MRDEGASGERYLRLAGLPGVGEEGLSLLSKRRVLVVGAGGLGTPCATYLVACGTGHVSIVDGDAVELSNLSRQVMYSVEDIGKPKAQVLAAKLRKLNPEAAVEGLSFDLDPSDSEGLSRLVSGYDMVFSCVDNAPVRYALNSTCLRVDVPLVDGSVRGFTGILTVVLPGRGPCYECAFPKRVKGGRDATPPIWSPLPGVVGTLQASEGLKVLLGIGKTEPGTALVLDLLTLSFARVSFSKNPSCGACGIGGAVPSSTVLQGGNEPATE